MDALVILNRGGGSAGDDAAERIATALAKADIKASIAEVEGGDVGKRARQAIEQGVELIIAAGGDGTVSAVAGALAGTKSILAVLPLGTLNHFARDIGMPSDLDEACRALAKASPQPVDLAELNGRTFINNSAIGLYPMMVLDREAQQQRLGRSKRLAMIFAAMRTVARFRHHRLSLTVNNRKARIDTPLLFVGNNEYRLDLGGPGKRQSLRAGRLCVYVLRQHGRLGLVAAAIRALAGRTRADDMVQLEDVQQLRVESHRSQLAVSLDGEVYQQSPPLDYRILPKAVLVLTP